MYKILISIMCKLYYRFVLASFSRCDVAIEQLDIVNLRESENERANKNNGTQFDCLKTSVNNVNTKEHVHLNNRRKTHQITNWTQKKRI